MSVENVTRKGRTLATLPQKGIGVTFQVGMLLQTCVKKDLQYTSMCLN